MIIGMEELLAPTTVGITDEDIANLAPQVRAHLLIRLERAWSACEPHLVVQRNPETGLTMRPDVRFVEAGIRICDRLASLFRLQAPGKSGIEPITERNLVQARVLAQIEEMETRMDHVR